MSKRVMMKCKVCNKPYSFTEKRIAWFKEKGLEVPSRCGECIEKRKRLIASR